MTKPHSGTPVEAVTIHQSTTESMCEGRKFAESGKIEAMIQTFQMIPAPAYGQAQAKRLIRKAADSGDGWLMASDYNDMTEKLRALFWNDSSADLMAEDIPMFLSRKLTGPDGKRMGVDDAEAAGLLLTEGAAVPPVRRLRGVRLDVLSALALECSADNLVRLIAGITLARDGIRHAAPAELNEPEDQQASMPVQTSDFLPPLTTNELSDVFDGFNWWEKEKWRARLGSASNLQWLLKARVTLGTRGRGGSESTWNPVLIAVELVKRTPGHKRFVLARFQNKPALKPWLDQLIEAVPSISEPT